eukprot:scaffold3150_cov51-Attheya_sp.AAC.8
MARYSPHTPVWGLGLLLCSLALVNGLSPCAVRCRTADLAERTSGHDGRRWMSLSSSAASRHSRRCQCTSTRLYSLSPRNDSDRPNFSNDIVAMEREVQDSVDAQLDWDRVQRALTNDGGRDQDGRYDIRTLDESEQGRTQKVALAASSVLAFLTWTLTNSPFIAFAAFAAVLWQVGFRKDYEGVDDVWAPAARVVGRLTLDTVEKTVIPKAKAMTRAAVLEEQDSQMRKRLAELEQENGRLKTWIQQRIAVDESLNQFSLDELKGMARRNRLPVGGNKAQLMMRLLDEDILDIESLQRY